MKYLTNFIFSFLFLFSQIINAFEITCPQCIESLSSYDSQDEFYKDSLNSMLYSFSDCLDDLKIKSITVPCGSSLMGISYQTMQGEKEYVKTGTINWFNCYINTGYSSSDDLYKYEHIQSRFQGEDYFEDSIGFNFFSYEDTLKAFSTIRKDLLFICETEKDFYEKLIEEKRNDIQLLKNRTSIEYTDPYFGINNEELKDGFLYDIKGYQSNLEEAQITYNKSLIKSYEYQGKIEKSYQSIFDWCIEHHHCIGSYYQRGLLNFNNGNIFEALLDIDELIKDSQNIQADMYLLKGQAESELGLYYDAIISLSKVIEKDPKNKEAYFEKALAYFETGQFNLAIEDFLRSDLKSTKINSNDKANLEFAKGLIIGIAGGIKEDAIEFVPSVLASANGLNQGLWALIAQPIDTSKEMIEACQNCIIFIKKTFSKENLENLVPVLKELVEKWENLSSEKRGSLTGHLIGKYGIDIFITKRSIEGIKFFRDLKKANTVLTFEKISIDKRKAQAIQDTCNSINKRNLEVMEKIKAGEDFLKPYQGQYLSETTARKIIHQAGFKTFPRPKGIPDNYLVKLSDRGGGMKYINPNNSSEYIRVMPGKPYSTNPCQQKPYINWRGKDGLSKDKFGNKVKNESIDSHIPYDEFINFKED